MDEAVNMATGDTVCVCVDACACVCMPARVGVGEKSGVQVSGALLTSMRAARPAMKARR